MRSVKGFIRGSMGERRIPLNSFGGVCMSITVAQQRRQNCFSKRQESSIISFATQPCTI